MKLETLISRRAASIRAHRAVSSSRVTVTFFMCTILVSHEIRVNWGMSEAGTRRPALISGRTHH